MDTMKAFLNSVSNIISLIIKTKKANELTPLQAELLKVYQVYLEQSILSFGMDNITKHAESLRNLHHKCLEYAETLIESKNTYEKEFLHNTVLLSIEMLKTRTQEVATYGLN